MSCRGLLIVLIALVFVGCKQEVNVVFDAAPPPPIETDFDRLPIILSGIPKTGELSLFEGLPSEFWEPQLMEQELARTKTTMLHGYPLYKEQLTIQGSDGEQLTAVLSAPTSFTKFTDGKKGGGFHADYCLEWKFGEGTTHVVISLEGSEVKMYGPKSQLHCDLTPEAAQKLKQILGPYRKNRPMEEPSS